jgi:hypothetical protein
MGSKNSTDLKEGPKDDSTLVKATSAQLNPTVTYNGAYIGVSTRFNTEALPVKQYETNYTPSDSAPDGGDWKRRNKYLNSVGVHGGGGAP